MENFPTNDKLLVGIHDVNLSRLKHDLQYNHNYWSMHVKRYSYRNLHTFDIPNLFKLLSVKISLDNASGMRGIVPLISPVLVKYLKTHKVIVMWSIHTHFFAVTDCHLSLPTGLNIALTAFSYNRKNNKKKGNVRVNWNQQICPGESMIIELVIMGDAGALAKFWVSSTKQSHRNERLWPTACGTPIIAANVQ